MEIRVDETWLIQSSLRDDRFFHDETRGLKAPAKLKLSLRDARTAHQPPSTPARGFAAAHPRFTIPHLPFTIYLL
jgi:hypothetical protein